MYQADGTKGNPMTDTTRDEALRIARAIVAQASAQEKLEHYERLMLKYGKLMDELRQELLK